MNKPDSETRANLLDRFRKMAMLQQWIWEEATTIADEILGCELEAVLDQLPDIAVDSSGDGEDLTEDDLDNFLEYCARIVTVRHFRIDLDRMPGCIPDPPAE